MKYWSRPGPTRFRPGEPLDFSPAVSLFFAGPVVSFRRVSHSRSRGVSPSRAGVVSPWRGVFHLLDGGTSSSRRVFPGGFPGVSRRSPVFSPSSPGSRLFGSPLVSRASGAGFFPSPGGFHVLFNLTVFSPWDARG